MGGGIKMETYVWLMFIVYALSFIARAFLLAYESYPRQMIYSRSLDMASLIVTIGFLVWTGILIF